MAAVNKLNEVVFLTALLSGDISLARLNWRGKGLPEIEKPQRQQQELSLFPE